MNPRADFIFGPATFIHAVEGRPVAPALDEDVASALPGVLVATVVLTTVLGACGSDDVGEGGADRIAIA